MSHIKCANCGFINFVQAEFCRKCNTSLHTVFQPQQPYPNQNQNYGYIGYSNQQPNRGYSGGYSNQYGANNHASESKRGFPVLKSLLVLLEVLFVGAFIKGGFALIGTGKVKWREFRPNGSTIIVRMPSEPKANKPIETPTQMGTMKNHIYISSVTG